ncbi:MAG TPA: hypothetical protein VHK91_16585 [Flavisolibacter sp.]|nr:hypothetical protein [Flavisolibacter sp.]
MKKPILSLLLIATCLAGSAQTGKIGAADLKILQKKEDSLKTLSRDLLSDSLTGTRMRSDSLFIKILVRSLQVKNSFYYPFDSVQGVSKLFAPDSSFKIFTWQISFDDYYSRQRGAIQYNTPDGSLKLVPLRDYSEFSENPMDSVRGKNNWIGAVYYNMALTKYNGKNYYTLFGFDEYGVRSNKKWIEVLTFDERNQPVFGGSYFTFDKDSLKRKSQYRFNIEYKKDAATTVNYDPEMNMILFDHLISESDEPDNPWTFIPDGDYEGFKWVNGKWQHVDKVFTEKLKDGEFPMPNPIRDNDGNSIPEKPKEQAPKNKPVTPKKKTGGNG